MSIFADISTEEVQKILDRISDIKMDYKLYDMHVHPNEIIFNEYVYMQDNNFPNVQSLKGIAYRKPEIADIKFSSKSNIGTISSPVMNKKIALMMSLRKMYAHIGPEVFADHMAISGIDQVLLLPVSSSSARQEIDIEKIHDLYGNDNRFLLAYSLPVDIKIKEIKNHLKGAKDKFNIKAIKVHPNFSGMDLSKNHYIDIFEEILVTAEFLKLPIVLHGGKSNLINNSNYSNYAVVENFLKIDFSLTNYPVVIAHSGLNYIDFSEQESVLKAMGILMDKYSNIYIDISMLKIYELEKVIRITSMDRILFGTDALYDQPWRMITLLFYLLEQKYKDFEDKFIRICSINPGKTIFY